MRRSVAFAVAALLVAFAGRAQDKQDAKVEKVEQKEVAKPDPDLKLLQGKWKTTYHETAGEKDTGENLWEMVVKGDRYTLTADGTFPHNVSGGQLSVGQAGAAGGFLGLVEAVRQLTGETLGASVPDAKIGLVSGFGMITYDRGLACGAALLAGGTA